ncbi:MAG TPA: YtxH domain-containing protein [Polyangiaceae bacterium]|nr:YtxH domain-containing protein [Polyangiaceae bacterium]
MNTRSYLNSLRSINPNRMIRQIPAIDTTALLGWVGLARRRSRFGSNLAWIATGFVLGTAGALLLAPSSGRELRSKVGGRVGGGVGKLMGEVAGAHPVETAHVVGAARNALSAERS